MDDEKNESRKNVRHEKSNQQMYQEFFLHVITTEVIHKSHTFYLNSVSSSVEDEISLRGSIIQVQFHEFQAEEDVGCCFC